MSGILSRRQREGERKRGRRGVLLKSAAVGRDARGERSAKGGGRRVRQRLLRLLIIFIVIYFNVLLCVLQESGDRCAAERRGDGCGVSRGARDERPEVRLAPPRAP